MAQMALNQRRNNEEFKTDTLLEVAITSLPKYIDFIVQQKPTEAFKWTLFWTDSVSTLNRTFMKDGTDVTLIKRMLQKQTTWTHLARLYRNNNIFQIVEKKIDRFKLPRKIEYFNYYTLFISPNKKFAIKYDADIDLITQLFASHFKHEISIENKHDRISINQLHEEILNIAREYDIFQDKSSINIEISKLVLQAIVTPLLLIIIVRDITRAYNFKCYPKPKLSINYWYKQALEDNEE